MNKQSNILVIEDDKIIRNLITTTLEISNYDVQSANNAKDGIIKSTVSSFDVILLDLGLPDMDGMEVIKKIRSFSLVPIIVVSARTEYEDKIQALDEGADDYITKPFNTEELLARVRAAARRNKYLSQTVSNTFENGNLKIDFDKNRVQADGKEIRLTAIEYKLLCLFAKNLDKVLTHNFIKQEIWLDSNGADSQLSLRVFVTNLRKKLNGEDYIKTHIGIGYRMTRIKQ